IAHFYALAGPDFVLGPAANPAKRNVLGVVEAVGLEIGGEVIKHRSYAQKIQAIIGGKATHPVCGIPGGMSRPITEEERAQIEEMAKSCVEFAKFSIDTIFTDVVLKNEDYLNIIVNKDLYYLETYYMGTVDKNNKVNFYDGDIRVVDPSGKEYVKFKPVDYHKHIDEKVLEWSYLKFPFLKNVGWKGLVDGPDSGIYRVNTLARLNVADGMATPLAQKYYEQMYATLGGKPAHHTLAFHWARLIEMVYASERLLELSQDPEIISTDLRADLTGKTPTEGVGVVEAPRGTLFHHYTTDEKGFLTKANIIVATGQNNGPMCMSIKKVAQAMIKNGQISNGLLNMVEMAFRAYDPCLACATHTLPGQMPLEVRVYDHNKKVIKRMSQ
ncbi:MAG: Ni/Fe hydrogenase subunit alpha, partial [Methanopyri archaeon]|nr:Ni/Fe hydrogenase subunit alpha [Methanopyri archaeon]